MRSCRAACSSPHSGLPFFPFHTGLRTHFPISITVFTGGVPVKGCGLTTKSHCRRQQLRTGMFKSLSRPLMGQGAVSLAYFYPSTLLSFHKKEDDSWCSGSLGKGSKHSQGWAGHCTESSVHSQACTVHTTRVSPAKMAPAELSDSAKYHLSTALCSSHLWDERL